MPGSLHILVTSFFVFWLFRMTKIIFYVCLLTHFARQDRQNENLKNKQNQATKVTKIQKNEVTKMTWAKHKSLTKKSNLPRNWINFWTNWITVVSATTGQSRIKRDVVILACRSTGLLKGAPKSNWATIIRKIDNVTIQSSNSNIHYNDELLSCWSNSITVASALWF